MVSNRDALIRPPHMARYGLFKERVTKKNVDALYFLEQTAVLVMVLVNIYLVKNYASLGLGPDRLILEFFTAVNLLFMMMEIPIIIFSLRNPKHALRERISILIYLILYLGIFHFLFSEFLTAVQ